MNNQIEVTIKFLATLKHYFPEGKLKISLTRSKTLSDLLSEINNLLKEKSIPYHISDKEYLILIDDVHISAMKGLNTIIEKDCTITIIPLIHGGFLISVHP